MFVCVCSFVSLFLMIPTRQSTSRRNQNFVDILRLLCLGEKNSVFDLSLRFTHLFWCGDLNYRLDFDVQVSIARLKKNKDKNRPLRNLED